jgi:hypothetical protein
MHDVLAELRPLLVDLLVAVAIALVGIASTALVQLKGRGLAWLGALSEDRRWGAAIGKLEEASTAAVRATEQSLVGSLKALEPIGELTESQARQALAHATDAAKQHLGPQTWREIGEALKLHEVDLEALLRTRIEAAVQRMRSEPKSAIALIEGTPAED